LVNRYLIDVGGLDIQRGSVIGFVVETMCRCHAPFTFPEDIDAGLRVAKLGSSSVRYELGLFGAGESKTRADGHFIHAFVDRATQRPVPMPEQMRAALARLLSGRRLILERPVRRSGSPLARPNAAGTARGMSALARRL
jgi:acyl-CoA thioester hydrolase